jgi:hypothetical protein
MTNQLPGSELPQEASTQPNQSDSGDYGGYGGQGDGTSNGDGGDNEFATKEDVSGIHSRLDEIQGGMQSGGGAQPVQNRMEAFGQGTGSQPAPQAAGTQRSGADILAGYHQQTLDNLAYSQGLHEQVSGVQASLRQRAANWAARTPQGFTPSATGNGMSAGTSPTSVQSTGSGIGASAAQNEQTMGSLLPVQNGMSDSTYANKRFRGQQS